MRHGYFKRINKGSEDKNKKEACFSSTTSFNKLRIQLIPSPDSHPRSSFGKSFCLIPEFDLGKMTKTAIHIDHPAFTALRKTVAQRYILHRSIIKMDLHVVHFQGTVRNF